MTDRASPIEPTDSAKIQRQEETEAKQMAVTQEMSDVSMSQFADEAAFNPMRMATRFQNLEDKRRKNKEEEASKTEKKEEISQVERVEEVAEQLEKRNPEEFKSRDLLQLRSRFTGKETPDEILKKVLDAYPDYSLADEVLDFLSETAKQKEIESFRRAQEMLRQTHGREIKAGQNIGAEARSFALQGLGTPSYLRDLYRDITGNPREAADLFTELSEKFSFNQMEKSIAFMLHALGADLKSKGPSIARAELHRLMTEGKNMQAILWVYRFFLDRMGLITAAFERTGQLLPMQITFELLAKIFIQLLRERYPSMEKVLQLALKLGLSANELAQIIVFSQMRDAVRGVAPRLFRSPQHRHDILMSFIEALDELEERIEEQEEEEGEKKKKKQDKEEEET